MGTAKTRKLQHSTDICLLHGGGRCEMGNSSSTNGFWPPGKLFQRKNKQSLNKKTSKHTSSKKPPPTAPMYDTVANDIPVYSVVDKSRQNHHKVEENVQYAEIEVIRRPTKRSQKKPAILPKPVESTEYATLNFHLQNDPPKQFRPPPSPGNTPTTYVNTATELKSPRKYSSGNGTLV